MLEGKTVLVTGATGLLGGRLVEKLILSEGAEVRALVRNYAHAARLARFPVNMVSGHIADQESIHRAVSGCDVIFHCAHDFGRPKANIAALEVLADACVKHDVKRLVYVSSVAVYQPYADGDVTEESPEPETDWSYALSKRAAERRLLELVADKGVPGVIVQPSALYGPFGRDWTDEPVQTMLHGTFYHPEEGDGLVNIVYIDDAVDALMLAATSDHAIGERFLVSGPESVTWKAYFEAYANCIGAKSLVYLPESEIRRLRADGGLAVLRVALKDPIKLIRWLRRSAFVEGALRYAFDRLADDQQERVRHFLHRGNSDAPLIYLPDDRKIEEYRGRGHVRIDKARTLLGYDPKFSFERGIDATAQYIDWAYPVSSN